MNEQSVDQHGRRQSLSALMDGEATASDIAQACAAWRDDEEARLAWTSYQLIGDALRSEELAGASDSAQFLNKLRARLADEPVVLAPQAAAQLAASAASALKPRARTWSGPLAVAASFVAVLAGVLALQDPVALSSGAVGTVVAGSQSVRVEALHPEGGQGQGLTMALVGAVPVNAGLAWSRPGTPMARSFSAQASQPALAPVNAADSSPADMVFAPSESHPTNDLVWMIR